MSKHMSKTKQERKRFSREFKEQAVKAVLDDGNEAQDIATRLGVDIVNLKRWVSDEQRNKYGEDRATIKALLHKLKAAEDELKRVKMEKDILKKAVAYFATPQG